MEKVTQQVAANAEESAAASEEMNAQAEQLSQISAILVKIVGEDSNSGGMVRTDGQLKNRFQKVLPPAGAVKTMGKAVIARRNTKEVRPEQLIPLEDGEFKEF